MSSAGKIEYQIIVNDAGLAGKVGQVNNSLNSVGTAAGKAGTGVGSLNTGIGEIAKQTPSTGQKIAAFGSNLGVAAVGVSTMAIGVVGLMRGYRDLGDMQLKVDVATKKLHTAQRTQSTAQAKVNKLVAEGKKGTPEYAKAVNDLKIANEGVAIGEFRLSEAQEDFNDTQQNFYLNLIPTIAGAVTALSSVFSLLGKGSGAASTGINTVGTSVGGLMKKAGPWMIALIAISAILIAIKTNAFGFRDALNSVGKAIGDMFPFLKPLLQWIKDFATALGLAEGDMDMGKAFQLLSDGFKTAVDTIMKTDWSKVLGDMTKNIADFLSKVDWVAALTDTGKALLNGLIAAAKVSAAALTTVSTWIGTELGKLFTKDNLAAAGTALLNGIVEASKVVGTTFNSFVIWAGIEIGKLFTKENLTYVGTALTNGIIEAAKVTGSYISSFVIWVGTEVGKLFTKENLSAVGLALINGIVEAAKATSALVTPFVISVGTEIGKLFTVKNLTAVGAALLKGVVDAAKDIKPADVQNFIINLGVQIGKLFTVKNLTEVGLALLNGIVGAAKATAALVLPILTSIANALGAALGSTIQALVDAGKAFIIELGKSIITAVTGDKKIGPDTLKKFADAIMAAPVNVLTGVGEWIWKQVTGGIGALAGQFTEFVKGLGPQGAAAAGGGGGGTPVQVVTPSVNGDIAKGTMTAIQEYWKQIASNIQGIRPVLFINDITAKAVILGVQEYWKQIGGNIQGIAPVLPLNSEGALALILAVQEYWKKIGSNIQGLVPQLTANNTAAIQIMGAVMKTWQSAVSTLAGMKPALSANNTAALAAEKAVEVNWRGYANAISKVIPKITVNNSQALNAIKAVQNAMNNVKNVSRTITITTRYVTVGRPAAHNITGIQAHNITGAGQTTAVAPLIGGGNMTNIVGGGQGDVNVTINMRDEFGIEKQRKFKAVLGKDRYVFGSVGAGG